MSNPDNNASPLEQPLAEPTRRARTGRKGRGMCHAAEPLTNILARVLDEKITVRNGDRKERRSYLNVIVTRLAFDAASGNARAIKLLTEFQKDFDIQGEMRPIELHIPRWMNSI